MDDERKKKLIQLRIARESFYGNFRPTKENLDKMNQIYKQALEQLWHKKKQKSVLGMSA